MNSLHSHLFPPDLVNLHAASSQKPDPTVSRYIVEDLTAIHDSHEKHRCALGRAVCDGFLLNNQ